MHSLFTGPLTIEALDLAIDGLPKSMDGLKLIQMSDFHADRWGLSDQLLQQSIAASNREYPDLVLLTGDFITSKPEPIDRLAAQLKNLESRHGTYAILGNHDLYPLSNRSRVIETLTAAGITVLWNEICYPCGPGLALVGFADVRSREFLPSDVMPQIPPEIPRIVLAHNPDCAEALKAWRVDLQLSGHTHGGQICIPGLGSIPAIATRSYNAIPHRLRRYVPGLSRLTRISQNWDWERGYHEIPPTPDQPRETRPNRLYTNRGLGTYPPGRFFCTPEITRITLYRKSGSPGFLQKTDGKDKFCD
jgi:uncharacterized protein